MDGAAQSLRGTAYWMAPEVIKQSGHGRPADIWSIGCTVVEMLTGRPPWAEMPQISAMYQIATTSEMPPLPADLSPEALDLIRACLQREPSARPTAEQLLQHPFIVGQRLYERPDWRSLRPMTSAVVAPSPFVLRQATSHRPPATAPPSFQVLPRSTSSIKYSDNVDLYGSSDLSMPGSVSSSSSVQRSRPADLSPSSRSDRSPSLGRPQSIRSEFVSSPLPPARPRFSSPHTPSPGQSSYEDEFEQQEKAIRSPYSSMFQ